MEIIKSCCLMCTQECTTCIQYTSGSYVFYVLCQCVLGERVCLCTLWGAGMKTYITVGRQRYYYSVAALEESFIQSAGCWPTWSHIEAPQYRVSLTSLCFKMGCDPLWHRYLRYPRGMQTAMGVWVQTWNLERMDSWSLALQSMINGKLRNSRRGRSGSSVTSN